jgi:cysteine synthase
MTELLNLIGNTPLLMASNLRPEGGADIALKLEGFNATGSVKARTAYNLLTAARERGELPPGRAVVETSSGNLGRGLAMCCGIFGIECHLVVDPKITDYSRAIIKFSGAHVHSVDAPDEHGSWVASRLARAREIAADSGALMLYQHGNPDNPRAHELTTAPELLSQLDGRVPDVCVVGVGSGGQISGLGRAFRAAGHDVEMVAVDIEGSSIFGGTHRTIQWVRGLGLSWWPDTLDGDVISRVYRLPARLAITSARMLASRQQLLSGGSAGAVVSVALREAAKLGPESLVLGIIAERGDRYLKEFYDADWRRQHGIDDPLDITEWTQRCMQLTPLDPKWRDLQQKSTNS